MPKKKQLKIYNRRMLEILGYAIENKLAKNKSEWFGLIGFRATNEHNLKTGDANFTVEQITEACRLTGHSVDWVLGLSDTEFRYDENKTPLQRIKEAVKELENKN